MSKYKAVPANVRSLYIILMMLYPSLNYNSNKNNGTGNNVAVKKNQGKIM